MKRNVYFTIILILIIAGVGWLTLFNQKRKMQIPSGNNTQINTSLVPLPAGMLAIQGFNYGYNLKNIVVKEGDTVKISLSSDDSPHTFTIDEFGVNQEFNWGKNTDVSFIANKKGTFQYYCAVPDHRENGMIGTLRVE